MSDTECHNGRKSSHNSERSRSEPPIYIALLRHRMTPTNNQHTDTSSNLPQRNKCNSKTFKV